MNDLYRGGKYRGKQVAMEKNVCAICDQLFDTGSILMDMRFRRVQGEMIEQGRLPEEPVTGLGVCDTCKKDYSGLRLEDYDHVCLIECDPDKVTFVDQRWQDRHEAKRVDIHKPVMRTGKIGFVSKRIWDELFDVPVPEHDICFVEPGVVEQLSTIPGSEVVDVE